jgi:plasmid maintenance system antidote protein VapI
MNMPIFLKFLHDTDEGTNIKKLGFCMDNEDAITIDTETALKEGFTTTVDTFTRLQRLAELGQMYEEVEKSHKLEFADLSENPPTNT